MCALQPSQLLSLSHVLSRRPSQLLHRSNCLPRRKRRRVQAKPKRSPSKPSRKLWRKKEAGNSSSVSMMSHLQTLNKGWKKQHGGATSFASAVLLKSNAILGARCRRRCCAAPLLGVILPMVVNDLQELGAGSSCGSHARHGALLQLWPGEKLSCCIHRSRCVLHACMSVFTW